MKLSELPEGKSASVKGCSADADVKAFAENLGFVEGARVTVLSHSGRDVVVRIFGSRIAMAHTLADAISVG